MTFTNHFQSPLGEILLAADEIGLTGLWFVGAKYFAKSLNSEHEKEKKTTVIREAEHWLTCYFSGKNPDFMPSLHLVGTPFQESVWKILLNIPYGEVTTYGKIAKILQESTGIAVSAQAVGGAVGRNPISILVPCHRVVGSSGSLTGYAGGIDKKRALLELEGTNISELRISKSAIKT